jgi:peptide/nickel transport system substrate-binding protein
MHFSRYLFFIGIFPGIITGVSCNRTHEATNKKILYYNESKGVASLDPAYARNQSAIWVVNQIYNGLLQIDDSLNIRPCIAYRYTISSEGKEYTFWLRQDVYFHDSPVFTSGIGRKVTAYDVEYSFRRILDPKVASPGSWIFANVDTSLGNGGFKAVNDSVFRIYLRSPFPAFAGILTMPYCFIVPHEAIDFYGKDFRSHPVGTGPFFLKRWVEGEKMILLKNHRYFEKDSNNQPLPYLDAVVISFIIDKQSEFMQFISGKLDFISGVNPFFKDELLTRQGSLNEKYVGRLNLLKSPYLNMEYLGMLVDTTLPWVKKSPLAQKTVRQAINMAIDREKLVAYLRNNIGYPAKAGFVPRGIPSFCDTFPKGYPYFPDSARKLLAWAGYPNGKGLSPITLTTTSDYADICEYVQHELSQINIPIEIDVVNGLSYREMLANARLMMFRASWIADYPDAESFLSLFYSPNFSPAGSNYTHFRNDQFDRLYLQALTTKNTQQRYRLYRQMDQIIIEDAPVVPLFYDVAIRFTQKNIVNMRMNPLNLLILKEVDKTNNIP